MGECLVAGLQDSGVTGGILNFVDSDCVSTYDVIDVSLKFIRACNPMGAIEEPITLDFLTSGQLHAAPDSLPEMRHPLHGVLSGLVRSCNNEYVMSEIRLLDIEPPHKRTLVPQIFYKGPQRMYVEGIVRKGLLYVPRLVGSGLQAHHPRQYQFVTGDMNEKLWVH